jgi:mediator of RNA polymerase II transcription subunit 12, fungi type
MEFQQQVVTIVDNTDHLSLPFCQLELQEIFSISASSAESTDEDVSAALLDAVKTAIEKDQPCWSNLISDLEPALTNKVLSFVYSQEATKFANTS